MFALTGSEAGRGGLVSLIDSGWLLSLSIFHQPQGIGHRLGQSVLPRHRDQVHDHFRIAGGLKDVPAAFEISPKRSSIHQVTVMRDILFQPPHISIRFLIE